jgi:hypothetical protein
LAGGGRIDAHAVAVTSRARRKERMAVTAAVAAQALDAVFLTIRDLAGI